MEKEDTESRKFPFSLENYCYAKCCQQYLSLKRMQEAKSAFEKRGEPVEETCIKMIEDQIESIKRHCRKSCRAYDFYKWIKQNKRYFTKSH
jgi:hypothetical protein